MLDARCQAKYLWIQSTLTFELRRILTCGLKWLNNIAKILPYVNFQNKQIWGIVSTKLSKTEGRQKQNIYYTMYKI